MSKAHKDYIPGGYALLARVIKDSAIWRDDPHVLKLFIYLIMEARYDTEPKQYPGFSVNRGELVTSLSRIADDNEYFRHIIKKWSRAKVSRMLNQLKEQGYIEMLSDTYGTHISIVNYNTYQDPELYVSDRSETVVKRLCNGSETVVSISNKDNKDKNGKNDKKKRNIIPPQKEWVVSYCEERNNGIDTDKWFNHYTANGWKVGKNRMKDWEASVRTWEKPKEKKAELLEDSSGGYNMEKVNQCLYGLDFRLDGTHQPVWQKEADLLGITIQEYGKWRKDWSDKHGSYSKEVPTPPVEYPSMEKS